jgi:hypothetical protein
LVIHEKKAGYAFFVSLALLFLMFFFLGFLSSEKVEWLGLTLTQWVSLAGVLFGYIYIHRENK